MTLGNTVKSGPPSPVRRINTRGNFPLRPNPNNVLQTAPFKQNIPLSFNFLKCRRSMLDQAEAPNFHGLVNLFGIVLILTHFRVVYLTLYGYFSVITNSTTSPFDWPCLWIFIGLHLFPVFSYIFELALLYFTPIRPLLVFFVAINILCAFMVPSYLIHHNNVHPSASMLLHIYIVTQGLKLISYHHVNGVLRQYHQKGALAATGNLQYPANLTPGHLFYFICVPNFCYVLEWPRSSSIRFVWLIQRIAEASFMAGLLLYIVDDLVQPLLENNFALLMNESWPIFFEGIFQLSVYNMFLWLIGFYLVFHLYPNIVSELTYWGDREFYRDWWNAASTEYFWKLWNIPINQWITRHFVAPLLNAKIPMPIVYTMCFLLSAVLCEIILSISFHSINVWSFCLFLAQIPLVFITRALNRLSNKTYGNILFWVVMAISFPTITILYYQSYLDSHIVQPFTMN